MRIVDVCGFYAPEGGGVKTYVDRKLRTGPRLGHEMIVVAPGAAETVTEIEPGAKLVTLPCPLFPLDRRYRYFTDEAQVHAALDRLAPDLVECSTPWKSAGMVGRWRGNAPRSLVMHCDALATYPYRWLGAVMEREAIDRRFDWFWRHLRRLGDAYDMLVCANHDLGARLTAGGVANIVVEPFGVEPGLFDPGLRDPKLRAELLAACGLEPDATLLMGVGRHSPEKRWPMVIEAVTAAGYHTRVGMVLIGEGRDRARLERAIAGNPHVRLLTSVRDRSALARLLASGDALVHGCEAETFGMVAAEARASGIPVIVPDLGGASDQARDAMGWTYPATQAGALAETIRVAVDELDRRRARTASAAAEVRTMDSHFEALFARYAAAGLCRRAA